MKFIRKALLPAVIAAGFLGFLGAVGSSTPSVSADVANLDAGPGDVCEIIGPNLLKEGETADYTARIQGLLDAPGLIASIFGQIDDGGDLADIIGVLADGVTTDVNLDDSGGDSDITSIDKDGDGDTESIPATDHLNAIETFGSDEECEAEDEVTLAEATADLNSFIRAQIADDLADCIVAAIDCAIGDYNTPASSTPAAAALRFANSIIAGDNCFEAADDLEAFLTLNGDADAVVIATDLEDLCLTNSYDFFYAIVLEIFEVIADDREITVDVTCNDAGTFDLSFAPEWSIIVDLAVGPDLEIDLDVAVGVGEALAIHVRCGSDVDHGTITALPTTVEINPSIANVAHALVWVVLFDEDDDNANAGDEVLFVSDRCSVEASAVDTEEEFEAAEVLFRNNNPLNPATAAAIESSVYATTAPDGASRQQEEVNSFVVTGSAATGFAERTVAAVILHCDPIHAPGVTPGPAVVTAYVERGDDDQDEGDQDNDLSNNDDLVLKTTVTVVGPPAANGLTVTAAPATLACGEKATLDITVKDSIGQNVSDHTFVEIVTNAGGVLAGTGAVAGQQGLVSPVSSTVAETFGGKVTAYLLTSTQHVGKYEVVVTTGGGGGVTGQLQSGGVTTNLLGGLFTTQPISVQVTVECTVPAVPVNVQVNVPDTTGPRTGQGITPPSTGDAGLASTESNWVVGAVAAVVASLVIAGFAVKLVRDEN